MSKIGFCALHFDVSKYTRWPILEEWQPLGARTLAQVTKMVDDHVAASTAEPTASKDELIEKLLVELVVDAAARMDVTTIPCRSSALMQHVGWPCFLIDVGADGNTVRPIETTSWQDADEIVDKLEAAAGEVYARIRSEGDQVTLFVPLGHTLALPTAQ